MGKFYQYRRFPAGIHVIILTGDDNMMRTQVTLDRQEYELARREALAQGISIAEFVRRALRQALPPRGKAPWMRYAGFVESGDRHASQSIDELVYGTKD
jgi:Ribbon-helix-helix protein, copG family